MLTVDRDHATKMIVPARKPGLSLVKAIGMQETIRESSHGCSERKEARLKIYVMWAPDNAHPHTVAPTTVVEGQNVGPWPLWLSECSARIGKDVHIQAE